MTVEDPVEYVFPSVNQIQINEQAGVTFAGGLRSILRQDPDAILVGEIRDVETARIAVQSALTGHLVLSSLHATDAVVGAAPLPRHGHRVVPDRVVDARRRRPAARAPDLPGVPGAVRADARRARRSGRRRAWRRRTTFFHGEGCVFCSNTGYQGRIGVYEVLRVTDEMKSLIVANATHDQLKELAIEQGMVTLQEQALRLVERDVTTVAEIMRTIYVI